MRPPSEWPTTCADSQPWASINARASSAMRATLNAPVSGWLPPRPRLSNQRQRWCAASPSTCGRQASPWTATPWMNSTGGPDPSTP